MFRFYTDVIFNQMQVICQLFAKVFVKLVVSFFAVGEGNDRQTVDGNNSIKFKTTFVGEHTTYLTLNERVLKCLRCDFAE